MPALRRREPGYAGLAAIICGQQLSTASAAAIWARLTAAFDPFHHDTIRRNPRRPSGPARTVGGEDQDPEEPGARNRRGTAQSRRAGERGCRRRAPYIDFAARHRPVDRRRLPAVLPRPWRRLAGRRSRRAGSGEDRTWAEDAPDAKEMAPLAEPWRPMRGAAAHLWWTYYRAVKQREGVIAGTGKANPVLNNVAVAKRSSAKAKITAVKMPGSKK